MKPPVRIEAAAKARVALKLPEQMRTIKAVRDGRPLDAEPQKERRDARLRTLIAEVPAAAEALVRSMNARADGGREARSGGRELIQGNTIDFNDVMVLDLARNAAKAVGRVAFPDRSPLGTGSMISARLFLTNNHVIPTIAAAQGLLVEFDHERGMDRQPKRETRFRLDPEAFFLTSQEDDLDYTVVAIGAKVDGDHDLPDYGYNPLSAEANKHMLGEYVNIVQHPEGDYKQVVLRENQLVSRLERVLHYVADTQPGSSGSPVFNHEWKVVALHHWGGPYTQRVDDDNNPVPSTVNEGIRASAICKDLSGRTSTLNNAQSQLLQQALNLPAGPHEIMEPGRSSGGPNADGSAQTWVLPIEISVRIPGASRPIQATTPADGAVAITSASPTDIAAGSEKVRPDPSYGNRRGYNPEFLPGFPLALPTLKTSLQDKRARLLNVADGVDPFELCYQHFSIVMNKERKLPFFTITNINGSTWKNVDRKSGKVTTHEAAESAEASETWYVDPRIAAEDQCDQDVYGSQRPKRLFDRGHMVRRQDPCWGTNGSAEKANADTFHFANCTPQVWFFNEKAEYWQGLENYVLDNAKAEQEKVTVITGPVLLDDDAPYRTIKVPRSFFKILVRVENGELKATALRADQSRWVEPQDLPERLAEDFNDLGDVAQYQVSVASVEEATGLNFGLPEGADTFIAGGDGPESAMRPLNSFQELRLDRPKVSVNGSSKKKNPATR